MNLELVLSILNRPGPQISLIQVYKLWLKRLDTALPDVLKSTPFFYIQFTTFVQESKEDVENR